MAHILVIGGSKGIGLEAVKRALEKGHRVRAFARGAERLRLTHDNLEKRNGDALKSEDVAQALVGIDAVIQALGVAAGPDMVLRKVHLFSGATAILVPAMEKAGVTRLIAVTGFGAGDSKASINCLQRLPFRALLGRAYDDKTIQEDIIRKSELDWTIVRPGVLTRGPRSGTYRVLDDPATWRNGIISRADVADFLVDQIDSDIYIRQKPVLIRLPL